MMGLGAYRQDRMQRIWGWHRIGSEVDNDHAAGAFIQNMVDTDGTTTALAQSGANMANEVIRFDSSRVTRTGAETEPKNTALHYYIYVY